VSVVYICCWSSPAQSFSGPSSAGTHDHILLSQIRDFPNMEGQVPVFISSRNRAVQLYPTHWVSSASPPTTRSDNVEVFHPACPRVPGRASRHGPRRKQRFQQFHYCCMRIHFIWKVFTEPFFSSGRLFLLIKICCLAANVVSRSLSSNCSTCYNTYQLLYHQIYLLAHTLY
jgi:hypothetical protein